MAEPRHNKGFEYKGFTLAEVLITLGIIGVVAAITIPPLISSFDKKDKASKIKKFYSTMSQAIQLSEIENGPATTWVKNPMAYDEEGNYDTDLNKQYTMDFFKTYILPYMKYSKISDGSAYNKPDGTNITIKIWLNDGTTFETKNGSCIDVVLDTNAENLPNIFGKDQFQFVICNQSSDQKAYWGNTNRIFGPYLYPNRTYYSSRQKALQRCKDIPATCSALLIMYDNFVFKDDYPW